jgi:hypothetical protein
MIEKLFVTQGRERELLFEERAQLLRVVFLRFGGGFIRQRRLELGEFVSGQLAIKPGGPFLFKCFYKRLSTDPAASCARKINAT